MTDNKRVDRGRESQEIVAARLRELGLVHARSRSASLPGADIESVPGLHFEIKGTEKPIPGKWTKENALRAGEGELPLVVWRPRGYGPAKLDDWPVMLRWGDLVPMLAELGYLPDAGMAIPAGGV